MNYALPPFKLTWHQNYKFCWHHLLAVNKWLVFLPLLILPWIICVVFRHNCPLLKLIKIFKIKINFSPSLAPFRAIRGMIRCPLAHFVAEGGMYRRLVTSIKRNKNKVTIRAIKFSSPLNQTPSLVSENLSFLKILIIMLHVRSLWVLGMLTINLILRSNQVSLLTIVMRNKMLTLVMRSLMPTLLKIFATLYSVI